MASNNRFNWSIICVDDDEGVLDSYRQVLQPQENVFADILSADELAEDGPQQAIGDSLSYNLLLALSGEEAVVLVNEAIQQGHPVAAGFFDMKMPGGIDGYETIKQIRELDSRVHCAVVTAYTDRSVLQMRNLFPQDHQDELLYFKKPFNRMELEQTAWNMVCSWNRKRDIEEHCRFIEKNSKGLQHILRAVAELVVVPPRSLEQILYGVLYNTLALMDADDGFIAMLEKSGELQMACMAGRFEGLDLPSFIRDDVAVQQVLDQRTTLLTDHRCFIPLVCDEYILGLICTESTRPLEYKSEKQIIEVFRTQMVPLILNSVFYDEILNKEKETLTDPLTGLYNRRFIVSRLNEELSRSSRFAFEVSVLMIDIDDFKKVNDTYGHDTGDFVLKTVGEILQGAVRNYDVVGRNIDESEEDTNYAIRYGGEEFTAILAQTSQEGGLVVAERIRQRIEAKNFEHKGHCFKLTASIGMRTDTLTRDRLQETEAVIENIVRMADQALYQAKAKGKNRVEFFNQPDADQARPQPSNRKAG